MSTPLDKLNACANKYAEKHNTDTAYAHGSGSINML